MARGIYFYTIKFNGQQYAASAPCYQWAGVERYFGLSRQYIRRGARAGAEWLTDNRLEEMRAHGAAE